MKLQKLLHQLIDGGFWLFLWTLFSLVNFEGINLSNEKNTGCLACIGDEILPNYIGIIINHEIRIPINQPGFNGK